MRINRDELYKIIYKICNGGEYAIGMHGINYDRMRKLNGNDGQAGINSILENGLMIYSARTINGTVKFFGRIDKDEDFENVRYGLLNYRYGSNDYIIVAIPTIFRNKNGDELYLGTPNLESKYKESMGTTGGETTTLLDHVISYDSKIPSEFILGSCRMLDSGDVDLNINPNHIAFKKGIVSDEMFEEAKRSVNTMCYNFIDRIKPEMFRTDLSQEEEATLKSILEEIDFKIRNNNDYWFGVDYDAGVAETIIQLLNEKKKTKNKSRFIISDEKEIMTRDITGDLFVDENGTYRIKFSYGSKEDRIYLKKYFENTLMPLYGAFSARYTSNKDFILPYLINLNDEFITYQSSTSAIGGTNIPEDILYSFIKRLVESCHCKIKSGDILIEDNFTADKFDKLIENVPTKSFNLPSKSL